MCFNKILCLNGVYQFAPRPSFHYQPRYADPGSGGHSRKGIGTERTPSQIGMAMKKIS